MTVCEFAAKYNGKAVDFDKAYGAQCVDLFRQYCQDVVGCPHTGSVDGAKELWERFSSNREKEFFIRLNAMQARLGDVLIEDATPTNKWGHVSIILAVENDKALVIQQNGISQGGCELAMRSLKGALGILRPAQGGVA